MLNLSVTTFSWLVAMSIFIMSGWTDALALVYLQEQVRKGRRLGRNVPCEGSLRERLQNLVLAADVDFLLRLESPQTKRGMEVHKKAVGFLAGYQTSQWVHTQNVARGVAPSIAEAAQRFLSCVNRVGCGLVDMTALRRAVEDGKWNHDRGRAVRWWGQGFAKKWSLKQGRLRVRGVSDPVCVREQVACPEFVLHSWGKEC